MQSDRKDPIYCDLCSELHRSEQGFEKNCLVGQTPWFRGHRRRLVMKRLCVQIAGYGILGGDIFHNAQQ